jgi:hypothetical protein
MTPRNDAIHAWQQGRRHYRDFRYCARSATSASLSPRDCFLL